MDYGSEKNGGRQKTCRKCSSFVTHDKMEDGRLVCPLCGHSIGVAGVSTPHVNLQQFRKLIADFSRELSEEDPNSRSIEAFLDAKLGMVQGSPIKKDLLAAKASEPQQEIVAQPATPGESAAAEDLAAESERAKSPADDSAEENDSVSDSPGFDPADFGLTDDDMES